MPVRQRTHDALRSSRGPGAAAPRLEEQCGGGGRDGLLRQGWSSRSTSAAGCCSSSKPGARRATWATGRVLAFVCLSGSGAEPPFEDRRISERELDTRRRPRGSTWMADHSVWTVGCFQPAAFLRAERDLEGGDHIIEVSDLRCARDQRVDLGVSEQPRQCYLGRRDAALSGNGADDVGNGEVSLVIHFVGHGVGTGPDRLALAAALPVAGE